MNNFKYLTIHFLFKIENIINVTIPRASEKENMKFQIYGVDGNE